MLKLAQVTLLAVANAEDTIDLYTLSCNYSGLLFWSTKKWPGRKFVGKFKIWSIFLHMMGRIELTQHTHGTHRV